ncbi:cobyric acid synthase [Pararhodospirillum oryzae]|uniref:Cobyric acid synthase n=1 Tax=Pararhodospirillum oryzae TaxID=478448 RepID=A0A512H5C0_9PROT|nr:cobyric acid synthase [Pararhodospirillum oryzae]GEO80614.1 cobyric acid synthase [Pararhodospirillum oryzae]
MSPKPRRLMLQGTGSDVGKTLLLAGLARAYTRRGLAVRPFKAQNISNNSAVTADGDADPDDTRPGRGEIGRAQALQAAACKVAPSVHMNPVLLKPQAGVGSQVVLRGRVIGASPARQYPLMRGQLLPVVLDSLERVGTGADLVLVEGAGSPAEVHLKAGDIVNMALAEAADLPVLLVGDVDRGGVLAALVGTHALLSPAERARVVGYLINKFRGDLALFDPACAIITERTGWPCQGVVRWFTGAAGLPAEDSLALGPGGGGARDSRRDASARVRIAVPRLPHVANFDDLDPLAAEPGVHLCWIAPGQPLPRDADVIVLPGSKATATDLAHLRAAGWDDDLRAHVRQGGRVVGLCGGYQMLGRVLDDPEGLEGPPGQTPGLGLLDIETVITRDKVLTPITARDGISGALIRGYEMHMGRTTGPGLARPWLCLETDDGPESGRPESGRPEGAVSKDGRVMGSYLHGLFGQGAFRAHWLGQVGARAALLDAETALDASLDALADHIEANLDLDALLACAR